jgi:predicted membrane-bound spermidine synthase
MTRFAALLLTVATGFSGLVYEVAWQKYLATLLGSHAEATAAVLAIFLGGLAVGYALFGHVTRRLARRARRSGQSPQLLLFYAGIEACIGLYALAFPVLFGAAQTISLLVPLHAGLGFAFDVLLTIALIGPPTVLMGGTIPILTLALAGDLQHATRIHAWVYGFNTLGAFAGALAGGFFLVPRLGLDGVLYAMGGLNLVAGAMFALLEHFGRRVAPELTAGEENPRALTGFAGYAAVACLGGFAMMAVQTILNRIGGLALGASHFTFAMVVAVFVLCIALGSLAVSLLPRIPPLVIVGSQWLLVALLGWLYFALPDVPYYAHVLRLLFRNESAAFYPFHFAVFSGAFAFLLIPVGLSGALLPLLFHHLRREVGTLGAVAGRLYSWNTLGSLLGALLGGYVLLFWLDLQQIYGIALGALILGAATLTVLVLRLSPIAVASFAALPGLALLMLMPDWDAQRLSVGLFRVRESTPASFSGPDTYFSKRPDPTIVFYQDDPTSTITVRENRRKQDKRNLTLFTNGKSDGNTVFDYPTMGLAALVPALFAENLERCFVIGFGLGVTTGELAALEDTREVHVAEISQGVIDAGPLFDETNLGASHAPKVRIQRSDAYRALVRSEGQWDVVASEPSNPWVTGVEMLYSIEFLRAVRERLAPGGVFAQWFHLYELDKGIIEPRLVVAHDDERRAVGGVRPTGSRARRRRVGGALPAPGLLGRLRTGGHPGLPRIAGARADPAGHAPGRRPEGRAAHPAAPHPEPSRRPRLLPRWVRGDSQVRHAAQRAHRCAEFPAAPRRGARGTDPRGGPRARRPRGLPDRLRHRLRHRARALEARLSGFSALRRRIGVGTRPVAGERPVVHEEERNRDNVDRDQVGLSRAALRRRRCGHRACAGACEATHDELRPSLQLCAPLRPRRSGGRVAAVYGPRLRRCPAQSGGEAGSVEREGSAKARGRTSARRGVRWPVSDCWARRAQRCGEQR